MINLAKLIWALILLNLRPMQWRNYSELAVTLAFFGGAWWLWAQ